jgi:hypothetical protein
MSSSVPPRHASAVTLAMRRYELLPFAFAA